ncbi:MAG TPA: acyltransferase [Chthoniobacterales bacterium]|nr:acyltransferase [Chthoniobacterales bacterium]
MGWASYWTGPDVESARVKAFASGQSLTRTQAREGYQPQFDGLRALAVLTVMVDHFSADVPNFPLPDKIRLGATGVRLFLVLSGYFITASLRRARDRMDASEVLPGQTLRTFYWRRLLRTGPAYIAFVGIALLLNIGAIRQNWPWVLTGTVNWLIAWQNQWPLTISHLWSICVQEQFYLLWPLLILLFPRRWMMSAIIAVAFAGLAFRIGCVMFSVPLIARWVLPFGSLDSLAAGAALGWCGGRLTASRGGWVLALLSLSLITIAAALRNSDPAKLASVLVEPLEAIAFVILVARTATGFEGNIGRFLSNPGLVFAGRISYGLYVYHILVAMVLDRWLPSQLRFVVTIPSLRLVVFGIVTLFIATLSWRLLEQPIYRRRGQEMRRARMPQETWRGDTLTRSAAAPRPFLSAESGA